MRGIKKQTTFAAFIAVGLALPAVFLMQAVSAASAIVYLSPGSNSVNNGSNFSVSLRVNPNGNGLDGIETTVNFDTSKVQFVSASTSGGAFNTEIQQIVSGGSVKIARGEFGAAVTTDALVETITFRALVGSGSTSISLTGTGLTGGGSAVGASVTNATVNFKTPTTTTPTTPSTPTTPTTPSTPTKPSTPGAPATPATPANPETGEPAQPATKPTVKTREDKVQFTKAGIAVESNVPTKTYIAYGVSTEALVQTPTTAEFATNHSVQLDPKLLVPGTTYFYKVNAVDEQGNVTESEVKSFRTKGFNIVIAVFDKNRKPFSKQNLTLRSEPMEAKTDGNGFVSYNDVAPGTHTLSYSADGKEYSQTIVVDNNVQTGEDGVQIAPTQNFSATLDVVPAKSIAPLASTIGLILVLLIAAAYWYLKIRPKYADRRLAAQYVSGANAGNAVVGRVQSPDKPQDDTLLSKLSRVHAPNQAAPGTIVAPKPEDTERKG